MFLSRFGVKNYKCLGEIDIPLTPIHVLIGENDAGKTSLLEAMAAFCASSEMDLSTTFPARWDGRELVFHRSSEPQIELYGGWAPFADEENTALGSEFRYGFEVDFPPQGNACSTLGDWIERGGAKQPLRPQEPARSHTTLRAFNQGKGIPKANPKHLKTVSNVLKPGHKYAFDPKVMTVPAAIDLQRKYRLDADGFGLATLLGDILEYDAEEFVRLSKDFCGFFKQFKRVRVESEKAFRRQPLHGSLSTWGTGLGKGIYFETRAGQSLRAQQASDGAILFLGFLAIGYIPNPPNLLLIEEPENGIYPKRLGEVIELLKQLVARREGVRFPQIIMSTHSPYVLSFFEPEKVTFLSRPPDDPDGPVRARPLRDAPNIRERLTDGFYLGELWYNLSEEDLFGEP